MKGNIKIELSILPETFSICRLEPSTQLPDWLAGLAFWAAVRTADELSLVLPETAVPAGWLVEPGWRGIKVKGPLDFSLTGVLVNLCTPLAENGISIFAISTYDTDYILVREKDLEKACSTLKDVGYSFTT